MNTKIISRSTLLAALLALVSGSAIAHDKHAGPSHAGPKGGYLVDSRGHVVLDNFGHCWRTGSWTPAMAVPECEPDMAKKEAPKMEAKGAAAGPDKPAMTKITLRAETLFDFDKATLRDEGKKTLDAEVVGKMKAHPEIALVLVSGHTDQIGSDKYNQKLSERRAKAVVAYLTAQGIDAKRLEAVGKGEKEPVKTVKDCKGQRGKKLIECLQPNRRVVVEVKAQAQSGTGK